MPTASAATHEDGSATSPHAPWRLIIVEDDEVIASVYRRTVEKLDAFTVAGTFTRGEDVLAFLGREHADLMLLDLTLAGMSGLTLLQRLRTEGHPIEVIAVTATRRAPAVRAVVQRGAIDYIVKPFTIERLRQALNLFVHRASGMSHDELDQEEVDRVCASGRRPGRSLPKGLSHDRVQLVRAMLAEQPDAVSAAEVAQSTGLARVTARRYLEYLVASEQAVVEDAFSTGPGRPRKVYSAGTGRSIPAA
ncbi:MAG: response regulator [Solirubrobacteraceae bacterium]|nr:response regulator [Solirubrobacteraceae bacterium]